MLKKMLYDYVNSVVNIFQNILNSKSLSVPYVEPDTVYQHLICITGFGYSGSGTLLDFFSEFDNTTVIGWHDIDYSGDVIYKTKPILSELDFLRHYGGIFSLEDHIESLNPFIKDVIIKQLITLTEYNYRHGGIYTDKYMELTNEFINKLLDFKIKSHSGGLSYCPELAIRLPNHREYKNLSSPFVLNYHKEAYIYYPKTMSKKEYQILASEYIHNVLLTIPSKPYLILDQLLSDGNPDIEYHKKYCGKFKQLCVYRDPRDVFVTSILKNTNWIPKDVDTFIKWYRRMVHPYYVYSHEDFLMIRFEDFVLDYDVIIKNIMKFINISPNRHINPKKGFIPDVSRMNIGLWKKYSDIESIKKIENELYEYCYFE